MSPCILFACNMNSVRSPMAAALLRLNGAGPFKVDSAGVYEGGLDPFVEIVMKEIDVTMEQRESKIISDMELHNFDVEIALTPEAAVEARRHLPRESIELWNIDNPSNERGGREAILESYRRVRDDLANRISRRFPELHNKP